MNHNIKGKSRVDVVIPPLDPLLRHTIIYPKRKNTYMPVYKQT